MINIELVEFNTEGWEPCYINWQDIETQKGFNFIPAWNSIDEYIEIFKVKDYLLNCLILDNDSKKYAGHITISNKDKPDIAIWIFKEFRNRGYAKKALKKAINLFRKTNKSSLYAGIYNDNFASKKVFKSLGFTEIENDEEETNVFTGESTYQIIFKSLS
ncbi:MULTISPECIES: GNAT family N-acetyltransferase [unclassified Treponema]|uniref:GNAT family N-acetyltransferase n=1 Tax=unclassified Treponema TaxID=2638727 RepID=UPI0020A3C9EA|nr:MULTISPECIES: GNAT family N-acetyltransferase [unclassified Treponema]UTC67033.1 GNAT family N-acetyltransferase [Treponema sp. OMZ 789]UTC69764.1 GNAT family N-acetyltransferase [Treponema sp. OMZ 790]UTC72478.1 GNAT family N-acetyltransferase [Treponema sp. OMZ 791]